VFDSNWRLEVVLDRDNLWHSDPEAMGQVNNEGDRDLGHDWPQGGSTIGAAHLWCALQVCSFVFK
jgi:hypothetical protein